MLSAILQIKQFLFISLLQYHGRIMWLMKATMDKEYCSSVSLFECWYLGCTVFLIENTSLFPYSSVHPSRVYIRNEDQIVTFGFKIKWKTCQHSILSNFQRLEMCRAMQKTLLPWFSKEFKCFLTVTWLAVIFSCHYLRHY